MTDCRGVRLELPALLSGELSPGTIAEVEEHLASCAACSAELAELAGVVEALTSAPLEGAARAALEEEVFGYVTHLDAAELLRAAPLEGHPPDDLEARSLARAGALLERPRWARAAVMVAPAVVVLLFVLGAAGLAWRNEANMMEDQFGPPGEELQLVSLGGPSPFPPGGGAAVKIVHYEHDDYGVVLDIAALPPCERGSYYEVWLTAGDRRVSLGSFRVPGKEVYAFPLGIDPSLFEEIRITRESAGGDPAAVGPTMWQARLDI